MSRGTMGLGFLVGAISTLAALALGGWAWQRSRPAAGVDQRSVAKAALDNMAAGSFVGVVGFCYEAELDPAGASEQPLGAMISQTGVVYAGADGEVRLDVWVPGMAEPIVCCVAGSKVWMVWGDSPIVHRASYPVAVDLTKGSFANQVYYQSQQALHWAETLLNANLPRRSTAVAGARLRGARLIADISSNERRVDGATLECVPLAGGAGYAPAKLSLASGGVLEFSDFQTLANRTILPRRVDLYGVGKRGDPLHTVWAVTNVEEHRVDNDAFRARFLAPSSATAEFPHLLGECVYEPGGLESMRSWSDGVDR
jgi:hypothetical protein